MAILKKAYKPISTRTEYVLVVTFLVRCKMQRDIKSAEYAIKLARYSNLCIAKYDYHIC